MFRRWRYVSFDMIYRLNLIPDAVDLQIPLMFIHLPEDKA